MAAGSAADHRKAQPKVKPSSKRVKTAADAGWDGKWARADGESGIRR